LYLFIFGFSKSLWKEIYLNYYCSLCF
jgi:hypothetical protein